MENMISTPLPQKKVEQSGNEAGTSKSFVSVPKIGRYLCWPECDTLVRMFPLLNIQCEDKKKECLKK